MNTILNVWKKITLLSILFIIIEASSIVVFIAIGEIQDILLSSIIFGINLIFFTLFLWINYYLTRTKLISSQQVINYVDKVGYDIAGLGICIYDLNKNISWINSFIEERESTNIIGKNIAEWIPEIYKLLANPEYKLQIKKNSRFYEIRVLKDNNIIFLKDVTEYKNSIDLYNKEQLVFGIVYIDNLKNIISSKGSKFEYEVISTISQILNSWASKHNIFIYSTDIDRYIFLSKRDILEDVMANEKFSFIQEMTSIHWANKEGVSINIGVGYGNNDPNLLYEIALDNLKRAQSRGGDQAIIRNYGEVDRIIFGGKNTLKEKNIRNEIKFFALKVREKIREADSVLVTGHQWGDYDCIGAGLGMYELCRALGKKTKIAINFNYLDKNAHDNIDKLIPSHDLKSIYISPKNVDKFVDEKTLVIVVDTHIKYRTEVPNIFDESRNVIVIDHHILNEKGNIETEDKYIEPKASSSSEIITFILNELIPNTKITQYILDLMLTGMVLDTNYFHNRTSQKTFEAAAILKSWGADAKVAENLLKDPFEIVALKQQIIKNTTEIMPGFLLAMGNKEYKIPRSIIAQIAQELTEIKGIKAAFVIANDQNGVSSMSARSNGFVNVQLIAEKMNGGGHFNAAATQNESLTNEQMSNQLINVLKENAKSIILKSAGDDDESYFD
ncbi:hypothetical protein ASO20_01690 [Mycoplasma sp. (ex Biomphalaria glabrata)]|uniref:DHH family phosphoesterase n=1 Tax=Mycoplasma sp. (ex Biomphalaria glabrata) TaxID=1749074 RepID=UPI00073A7362|nr:DHH family phosphoesterase [Mycoplasma sp. (ex Biomphalaria glabrata)]ALV23360.1 hypothetical protein ASO20_01690 [Mycoplasma sp. (ex Biomphalaria glabrata)]